MKRRILITGHSRGIGKSIYDEFTSREDADVIGISSSDFNLEESTKIKSLIDSIGRIDVLVNNAAIVSKKNILDISLEDWNKLISINLTSAMLLTKYVIHSMIDNKYGKIINIGSIAGLDKSKTASFAYTVTKYGIVGMTRQLAYEYARFGININCVCPSQTKTEMLNDIPVEVINDLQTSNPSGRLAEPQNISKLVYFLSTSDADYINGECIKISGGL